MERFTVESGTRSGDNDEKILRLCGKSENKRVKESFVATYFMKHVMRQILKNQHMDCEN
ncbi:hypothetical protein GCM10023261_13170 [Bartonella jaculi]|uniref:Uncharacterized protein n=1 Tax=Bartonella jaculi TaxID=686226 RepID=A0ABP9N512_9HYPH